MIQLNYYETFRNDTQKQIRRLGSKQTILNQSGSFTVKGSNNILN